MQQFLQQVANNGSAAAAAATGATGPGTGVPGFNPAQLHHLMQQQQTFLSHHQVSGFLKLYIQSTISLEDNDNLLINTIYLVLHHN